MLHLQFTPFPFFETERLYLRPVELSDAPEILILRSDPIVNKYIQRDRARNLADAENFIRKISDQQHAQNGITWALCLKSQTRLIGTACYWNIDRAGEQAELGYNLMADYFNQKLMSEALRPIVKYGFEVMQLKRIDAYTHKDNIASQSLLRRLGFERNTAFENEYENKEELLYNTIYTHLASVTR